MRYTFRVVSLFILVLISFSSLSAQSIGPSPFIDTTDGAFDVSGWLMGKTGFLPMPIIITEPAINYGGGLALLYFHSSEGRLEKGISPDISGGMFIAGGNGTMAGGLFHLGFWNDDHIRYSGALLRSGLFLDFYFNALPNAPSVTMSYDAWVLYNEVDFRLGNTSLFLGPRHILFLNDATISGAPVQPEDLASSFSYQGLVFLWDTRDSIFTPNTGRRGELSIMYSLPIPVSDPGYWQIQLMGIEYYRLAPWLVFGANFGLTTAIGSTPLYMKPGVNMRGVPVGRYQGDFVLQAQTEFRFGLGKSRWDLMLFGGGAAVFSEALLSDKYNNEFVWSAGTGFRYEVARSFGMSTGIDIAFSNNNWAIVLVMGNAWR